jgi:hypothetical protein
MSQLLTDIPVHILEVRTANHGWINTIRFYQCLQRYIKVVRALSSEIGKHMWDLLRSSYPAWLERIKRYNPW